MHRRRKKTSPEASPQPSPEPERRANPELTARIAEACGDRPAFTVADMAGCQATDVEKYLSGIEPPMDFLARLCDAIDIAPDWLPWVARPRFGAS